MSSAKMNATGMRDVVLNPGDYFVGDRTHRVHTLLGSCVSITLWHPGARYGAMCHYMLAKHGANTEGMSRNARYGDDAVALMIEALANLGVAASSCQAKIFGGGEMFSTQQAIASVGRKNGDAARDLLRQYGIAVTAESIFGVGHRNIIFDVNTGDVWSRQVDPSSVTLANLQEQPCPISR